MTTHNALADCRSIVNRQIEFLEHELGIEAAFPVTILLLNVSQAITLRLNAPAPCIAERQGPEMVQVVA